MIRAYTDDATRIMVAEAAGQIGSFGAARALNDGEDRVHAHVIRGAAELKLVEDTVWSGCFSCSQRWALKQNYEYHGQALRRRLASPTSNFGLAPKTLRQVRRSAA